jgi:nucleotide-binding universal stress UspA family protein
VPMAHILITFDGSLLAEHALEPGLALARACTGKVTLLRVIPDMDSSPDQYALPENLALHSNQPQKELSIQQAESYLQDLVAIHDTGGLEVTTAVISGPVASTILDFAAERRVDLIAMTTHGRTGLRRWIYGSVTEKVLYSTSCAMLIIRPQDH